MLRTIVTSAAILLSTMQGQELRPGLWAGRDLSGLPLPVSGYQVYLLGEMHGIQEVEAILVQYLQRLNAASQLRDVAIEEDAVYQNEAQAFVDGTAASLPESLCLRSGPLHAIRQFNLGRKAGEKIQVHLVDIDSPAIAIRQHMVAVQTKIPGAAGVRIPGETGIRKQGLNTTQQLERLTTDQRLLRELRTIRHSIRAYQQGLEIGTGRTLGSSYLDDREAAIAENIEDLLREPGCNGVLALYGADHVSRKPRKDGGPERNRPFTPLALRLEQVGLRVFSLVSFPLSGRAQWRGQKSEMPWTAKDGSLGNQETLDKVLEGVAAGSLLYVDPKRQPVKLPSQDVTAFLVDAFLLLPAATPMENRCASKP